jgi:transcriptional regulator with XRE-family HTH domain
MLPFVGCKMTLKLDIGRALKKSRVAKGMTQEDFSEVSSRTYMSTLERGLKSPTLDKLEALAEALQMHPISLLALAYLEADPNNTVDGLLSQIRQDLPVRA